jgi:transaldolase
MDQTRADLAALAQAGIDLDDVTETLLREGIASFEKSFATLSDGIKAKVAQLRQSAA